MDFDISKPSPFFIDYKYKRKISKIQDEFLVRMSVEDNKRFVEWFAEKIKRVTQ